MQEVYFLPFSLGDPAGILFFGHVFPLAHQAFENFLLSELGYDWSFWFQNPEWIAPIRHTEANYLHPLQVGHPCQIESVLSSLSNSSFTFTFHFIQQNRCCCTVKTVHVFCNRLTKNKQPIPASILTDFEKCLNE